MGKLTAKLTLGYSGLHQQEMTGSNLTLTLLNYFKRKVSLIWTFITPAKCLQIQTNFN